MFPARMSGDRLRIIWPEAVICCMQSAHFFGSEASGCRAQTIAGLMRTVNFPATGTDNLTGEAARGSLNSSHRARCGFFFVSGLATIKKCWILADCAGYFFELPGWLTFYRPFV